MKNHATTARILTAVCALLLAGIGSAIAGEITGQDKAMMIEAARADLYAQLARQIKGLQVSENTLVANHATADSTREANVEGLVRGATVGEPQFLEDVCLIQGSITLEQVVENLKASRREFADGRSESYESIKRNNEYRIISAQGLGTRKAPASDRTVPGIAAVADDGLKTALAVLKGTGQEKLGAIEAARIDALAQLARQLKGVRISDDTLVNNMALDGRWTETSSEALIKGAQVVRYVAMEGELVSCVVNITLEQIVENVQRQHTVFSNGAVISSEKIRRYNPALVTVTATGYGAVGKGRLTGDVTPGRIIGSVR